MADGGPTPLDLMLFHQLERDLFTRLVRQLGQNSETISSAMSRPTATRSSFGSDACLERLVGNRNSGRGGDEELPLTTSLMSKPMNLRFFDYHHDVAINGVIHFFENVSHRLMFITFSRGYPLSREEIMEYFTTRYGLCVEVVMIERATAARQPMYGRVVFKSASMIIVVLNGQRTAKFMIKGKHLWARMYVPR